MKRTGRHRPTIEDVIEISGLELLHPGGLQLTRRTAEVAHMQPGMKVLDVSSGRGTPAVFYAREFGVEIVGVDIATEMVCTATGKADQAGLKDRIVFEQGDAQALPYADNAFDVVINECAVGIPEDSQKVLDEMVRVARPGGTIVIHESTWRKPLPPDEKDDFAERYGTTPHAYDEWLAMLTQAGVREIETEFDEWSRPEMFWQIREDRQVTDYSKVLSPREKLVTVWRVLRRYGPRGVFTTFKNEKVFYAAVLDGKLGYCLFKGIKGTAA
jgi:ubiquinone/menaquinone biosynthesis C-methylase UbiE